MGDDLSTGAKIGIGLIILCFLIAIVLSLLMVVKNITNSGANQMEGGLDQMMQSTYDDYDQKVVTGTKVKAAVKLFNAEPIAVIVNTRYNGENHIFDYGLLIDLGKSSVTSPTKESVTGGFGDVYKYPSSVGLADANNVQVHVNMNDDGVTVAGKAQAGPNTWNLDTRPMASSGTNAFIRDSGKYMAYLIKDPTGTIIGIYFEQQ